jgi:hypothetical protein
MQGPDRRLKPPVHELWASGEREAGWAVEVLLNEHEDGESVYRRNPTIRLALPRLGARRGDVAFLCPEVVLLYKSTRPTENDEADFRVADPTFPKSNASGCGTRC